jgi:RND superfamily putative drug exporter
VFGIFATLSSLDFKMMGVGLATAILIDATIVRAFLLPASMKLLGDWNWYLPKWLDWLPHVAHEPEVAVAATAAPRPAPAPAASHGRLSIEPIAENGHVRLRLEGDLDMVTVPKLAKHLHDAEGDRPDVVVVDLRGLRFMDSSGIRELFAATRRARMEGRRLVVVTGSDPIDRVLEMVRAERVMETVTDPAEVS